jgi:hypothetical protein
MEQAMSLLGRFERYPLTFGPTAIEHLPRLSAALGGDVQVYAKRDDCNSGLAAPLIQGVFSVGGAARERWGVERCELAAAVTEKRIGRSRGTGGGL